MVGPPPLKYFVSSHVLQYSYTRNTQSNARKSKSSCTKQWYGISSVANPPANPNLSVTHSCHFPSIHRMWTFVTTDPKPPLKVGSPHSAALLSLWRNYKPKSHKHTRKTHLCWTLVKTSSGRLTSCRSAPACPRAESVLRIKPQYFSTTQLHAVKHVTCRSHTGRRPLTFTV